MYVWLGLPQENFRVAVVRVRGWGKPGEKAPKGRTLFELWENTAFINTTATEIAFGYVRAHPATVLNARKEIMIFWCRADT